MANTNIVGVFLDVDGDNELKPFIMSDEKYIDAVEVLYGTEFECVGSLIGFKDIKFEPHGRNTDVYSTAEQMIATLGQSEGFVGILFIDDEEYDSKYMFVTDIEFFNAWFTNNGVRVNLNGDDVMSACYYDDEALDYRERYEGL